MAPHVKSKRKTLRQKYKIERKVREHRRKVRKASKAKAAGPTKKNKRKDPGIPNLWPYKQEMMQELERKRLAALEEKESAAREKRELNASHAKKDVSAMVALSADALRRESAFQENNDESTGRHSSDWKDETDLTVPRTGGDGSRKAFMKDFRRVVESSDVILEVLDARDPIGCRCFDAEKFILSSLSGTKRIVLVLNKVDMVPREVTEKWLTYLRNEFPTVPFRASTRSNRMGQAAVSALAATAVRTSECLGAANLMCLLKNYARNRQIKASISVGIIGFPNVGKSSLVNSLKRSRAVATGSVPGITRHAQEIILDKDIRLIDCPGIVFSNHDSNSLILRNSLKVDRISDSISPVEIILKRVGPELLMTAYALPEFSNVTEFLALVAKTRGKQRRGGALDLEGAAMTVLRDWNHGKIPFYTLPPTGPRRAHLSAAIVKQWGNEFEFDDKAKYAETAALRELGTENSDFVIVNGPCDTKRIEDAVGSLVCTKEPCGGMDVDEDTDEAEEKSMTTSHLVDENDEGTEPTFHAGQILRVQS